MQLSCPKNPSHLSNFSLSSPQGRIPPGNCLQGAVFKAPGAQRSPSCPGVPRTLRVAARRAAVPATLPKQRFKCHLVAHTATPRAAFQLWDRCLHAVIPSSPQSLPLPSQSFSHLCVASFLHVPPFSHCHTPSFSRARTSSLSTPPCGATAAWDRHTAPCSSHQGEGRAKPRMDLSHPKLTKAGRWLCKGTTCPVQTPECLCCHLCALSPNDIPKVGLAASKALGLQREPTAGCCGPHQQLPKDGFDGTSSGVRATRGL